MKRSFFLGQYIVFLVCITLLIQGCEASYPKEKLAENVVALCNKEFDVEVKAEVFNNTLAIYIPMPSLFDLTFGLTEEAQDIIQNVLMLSSRAVLSTDAGIEFYCIIAQDVRLPELQVVIVKYVEDVKRSFFNDISRGEYFKRTLFDININPQSQKEKNIKNIFEKNNLDEKWQESLLQEFFRSGPQGLKEFGYWNDKFYVKEISLGEFLAEQLAYRIRLKFKDNKELWPKLQVGNIVGRYIDDHNIAFFDIEFDVQTKENLIISGEEISSAEIFANIVEEITKALYGYKFKDFEYIRLFNINTNEKLLISRLDLYKHKKKKITMQEILQSIRKERKKNELPQIIIVQQPQAEVHGGPVAHSLPRKKKVQPGVATMSQAEQRQRTTPVRTVYPGEVRKR